MRLQKFTKRPGERKRYSVDYSEWLDAGELVASATYSVTPATTPVMEVDAATLGDPATSIIFFVIGGVEGTNYELEIRIITSGGQVKEDTILYVVR